MGKKIAIIGTVGLPAKYGGFETLAENLTKYLGKEYNFTVYCSRGSYDEKFDQYNGAKLVYLPLKANGIQSTPYDIISIFNALRDADILLILGVSGCIILPFVKLISSKKVIVNIDGREWKRGKWGKLARWFLKYSEKLAINHSDVVVADNKVIQQYISIEHGITSELIAYGADHVTKVALSRELLSCYKFLVQRYALSVCRVEPENNLHMIIDAIVNQDSLSLVIIGNCEASKYGVELRKQYTDVAHIHLLNPIYDQDILNQFRSNCYLYLHGHSAGGTNPSLVEAMTLGLPIFAYGVDYNKETTEQSAQYFCDVKELSGLVGQVNDESLQSIGSKMKEISNSRYRWEMISEQYSRLFS